MDHSAYIRTVPGATQAVLMIHGIFGTPRHFDCLLPAIPSHWSVYNILLDGHGGTVRDFSHTSMKKWKQQTADCLRELCGRYEQVVIIGHSMGTLLAIGAVSHFPQVKAMLLLNVPLCPWVRGVMLPRLLKLCFGKLDPDRAEEAAFACASGITVTRKLWQFLGCVPCLIELLILCRQTQKLVPEIQLPCRVYQSRRDELVSMRSSRFFQSHPVIRHEVLEHSGHFYYPPEDLPQILDGMREFLIP